MLKFWIIFFTECKYMYWAKISKFKANLRVHWLTRPAGVLNK